mgnify:CR=1 FL=1
MRKLIVILAALAIALGAAGAALASGGLDSGGSGGSGGGSSGGGGGGGTAAACTPVSNYVTSSGYVPYGAGITYVGDSFTLKSCSGGSSSYTITLTETDASGAYPTYVRTMTYAPSGKSVAYGFTNLPTGWDETWTITFTVADAAGNVVDSRSNTELTPKVRIS